VHFDLVKRVLRDIDRSGQSPEDIIQQVTDTVYPMYKAFIEPDLKAAHLRIYNPFNPFSGFMSPTYILKSAQPVEREAVARVLGEHTAKADCETYDIYLTPPAEDPETCQSWLRMRYRDGRYNLMFEEWVVDGKFIISPRVTFEVPVRILGGLMALGYEIGTIMQRTSEAFVSKQRGLTIKFDRIQGMNACFIQVRWRGTMMLGLGWMYMRGVWFWAWAASTIGPKVLNAVQCSRFSTCFHSTKKKTELVF
jgi:uridine kinase